MMGKQPLVALLCLETQRHLEVLASRLCGGGYEMPHGRLVRPVGYTESVRHGGCYVQRLLLKDQWRLEQIGQTIYLEYVVNSSLVLVQG